MRVELNYRKNYVTNLNTFIGYDYKEVSSHSTTYVYSSLNRARENLLECVKDIVLSLKVQDKNAFEMNEDVFKLNGETIIEINY